MGSWSITFANTALLAAGLALVVPYLVHLLTRRTPRRLVFPTVQFIRKAEASHSALFRLRDILLLLVRTAFVALLFLTFLKPVLRAQASREEMSGRRAAIVILDRSLSMGYAGTGFTPFARGQLAAAKIVDSLGGGDVANLILAGVTSTTSFTAPAANKYSLRSDLREARPTLERADFDAAIAEAVQQLNAVPDRTGAIYFVSDFQRSNWAAVNFGAIPENVETTFVPVSEEHPWNLAVTEVSVEPPSPVVSEDLEIICRIANYGDVAAAVPVTLELREAGSEDATTLERKVDLPAGDTASVSFRMRSHERGDFEGMVRIGSDGLAADDTRFFAFHISDRIDIALLTDESEASVETGGMFLERAIDPIQQVAGTERNHASGTFRIERMTPQQFASAPPAGVQLVVIYNVSAFGETAATALTQYLQDGGSIVYFLRDPADGVNLTALGTATNREIQIPFSLGSTVDHSAGGDVEYATFAEANFDDPMLRRFRESGDIGAAHFYRLFSTQRIGGQGQILIRYSDGNIALARTTYGAGSLLLCNVDLSRAGSDLAAKTVFVPLVQELLKAMRPHETRARKHTVGFAALSSAVQLPTEGDLRFTEPTGEAVTASVERVGDAATIAFPQTPAPGFYRAFAGDQQQASVAVNVDERESDLEHLADNQMRELVQSSRHRFAAVDGRDPESVRRYLEGVSLWPYLLVGALIVLAIEQLLLIALRR